MKRKLCIKQPIGQTRCKNTKQQHIEMFLLQKSLTKYKTEYVFQTLFQDNLFIWTSDLLGVVILEENDKGKQSQISMVLTFTYLLLIELLVTPDFFFNIPKTPLLQQLNLFFQSLSHRTHIVKCELIKEENL